MSELIKHYFTDDEQDAYKYMIRRIKHDTRPIDYGRKFIKLISRQSSATSPIMNLYRKTIEENRQKIGYGLFFMFDTRTNVYVIDAIYINRFFFDNESQKFICYSDSINENSIFIGNKPVSYTEWEWEHKIYTSVIYPDTIKA